MLWSFILKFLVSGENKQQDQVLSNLTFAALVRGLAWLRPRLASVASLATRLPRVPPVMHHGS